MAELHDNKQLQDTIAAAKRLLQQTGDTLGIISYCPPRSPEVLYEIVSWQWMQDNPQAKILATITNEHINHHK
jgi:hypothetical protein